MSIIVSVETEDEEALVRIAEFAREGVSSLMLNHWSEFDYGIIETTLSPVEEVVLVQTDDPDENFDPGMHFSHFETKPVS